jgi:tetratricopeptide (TPR) repeat protein
LDEPAVRKMNEAALACFQKRLASREAALPSGADRMADSEWKHLAAAALSQRFWFDSGGAMKELCVRLIEARPFDAAWAAALIEIVSETPEAKLPLFDTIRKGVADWSAIPGEDLPMLAMWDRIAEMDGKRRFTPQVRAELSARRAHVLWLLGRLDEAFKEAEAGLAALPEGDGAGARLNLVTLIGGCAAAYLEKNEYALAVQAGRRFLELDRGTTRR